jgi:sterol desaturase/sphingolipid hydroxylase (fatty acid hydroxylase superfamily)
MAEDFESWPAARRAALAQSPRIFQNPILEKLSRNHPVVPALIHPPIAAALLWLGPTRLGWPATIAAAFAGYVLWTLVEYLVHRFLFHLDLRGPRGARAHFLIHGIHHEYPQDRWRLVIPPLMSLSIVLPVALLVWLVLGANLAPPTLAGFMIGFTGYDLVHYHLHHARPRTQLGKWLQRRHFRHHFQDATTRFGVAAPWWDILFGTNAQR